MSQYKREFHETTMGQRFFEKTMPELVHQLQRLNENLEKLQPKPPLVTVDLKEVPLP